MNKPTLDTKQLYQVVQESLKINEIKSDLSMIDCPEWDSLRHIALIINLEDSFGIKIEHSEIIEMTTLDKIINVLLKKINYEE